LVRNEKHFEMNIPTEFEDKCIPVDEKENEILTQVKKCTKLHEKFVIIEFQGFFYKFTLQFKTQVGRLNLDQDEKTLLRFLRGKQNCNV